MTKNEDNKWVVLKVVNSQQVAESLSEFINSQGFPCRMHYSDDFVSYLGSSVKPVRLMVLVKDKAAIDDLLK